MYEIAKYFSIEARKLAASRTYGDEWCPLGVMLNHDFNSGVQYRMPLGIQVAEFLRVSGVPSMCVDFYCDWDGGLLDLDTALGV